MADPAYPNLVLIWTDEQRPDTMACYGNSFIEAPNLNALAEESFVFRHAYCVQPVCTPSRGSILTGLWPHQHGATGNNRPLRPEARTIAEMVNGDYRTAYLGKWHLGDEIIAQHGFETWVSIEDAMYRKFYSRPEYLSRRSDYHHFLVEQGFPPSMSRSEEGVRLFERNFAAALAPRYSKAHFLGRRAAEAIRGHDTGRPLLTSVNFLEPHMPFFGPYNDRHDLAAIPVGPAFARPPAASASLRHRMISAMYRHEGFGGVPLKSDWDWRRLRANYYGLVTLVDDAVGMILRALEESGLADNTIVVFTSDHGEMMGDHAMVAKTVLYEESVGIPLLVRVPWLGREHRMIEGRVSQIDLVPTLLELMNQPVGEHLMGRSRADVLRGEATLADNDVIAIWDGGSGKVPKDLPGFTAEEMDSVKGQRWRSLISADGWKLNLCAGDRCELYDLNGDPAELENIYDDPRHRGRIKEMAAKIRAWQARAGDDGT